MRRVVGTDISLNHGACVLLVDGKLADYIFATDNRGTAETYPNGSVYIPSQKIKDMQYREMFRLSFWNAYIAKMIKQFQPDFIGIEDYAYRAEMCAHQLGEIGGILRYLSWRSCQCVRIHDPSSIKMFTAHDGSADKIEMERSVHLRWPETDVFKKHNRGKYNLIEQDLCDAYAVAQLVWAEVCIRNGLLRTRDLHVKELQVFNRCTKRYPTSLLDREWVRRER